jgi:4-amino-4-deoxy-L-arabinose transferase-like glycosyltransferase
MSRYNLLWDTLALGALAGLLRLWGVGFDLPNLYHRDEARYVSIPLNILKTGDYNPHFFNYPTLFFYLLAAVYVLYFLAMASRGRLGNLDGLTLPEQVLPGVVGQATMPSQFLVGRGMVAFCGVLTVLLVYWLGRKAYGRRAGWLAALLLCFSPTHIRNSHFVAPDVTMVLISMASLAFSYLVMTRGRRQDYVLAGLLAGLAISTKYNAYAVLIPLLVAHLLQREARPVLNADLLEAMLACGIGFFIGTPFSFLDLPAFLNGLAFEVRHYATIGDPGTEGQNAWLWYSRYLLRTEGFIPLLAVAEGLRRALARERQVWLFISFPLALLLLVSSYAVKNDRTALPILPVLAILAGTCLDRAITYFQVRIGHTTRASLAAWLLACAVVLAVLCWPAWQTLQINLRFSQDDVRTRVTYWLEEQLPPGSRIVGEYYSPLLVNSKHHFSWVDRAIDLPLAWYQENADYVVFVENRYGGFYLDPQRYPAQIAAYQAMFAQFTLVKEFQGGALGNPCHAMLYKVVSPHRVSDPNGAGP